MKRVKTMGKKYILYNSLAGNGKCMYDVQALADTYPDAILKKMTEIASYAEFMGSLAEDDEVILCGGDGTLNIFVNDIKDMDVKNTIYYYASGSGNDFAKDIGHNSHDTPDYQINQYIQHLPEVTINGKKWLFMNNVGFGIDGYCCEEGDRQRTKNEKTHKNKPVNYTAIAIKGLLYAFKPRNAVVKVDGVRHEWQILCRRNDGYPRAGQTESGAYSFGYGVPRQGQAWNPYDLSFYIQGRACQVRKAC